MGGCSTTYAIALQAFVFAAKITRVLAALVGGDLDGFWSLGCNDLNPRHSLNLHLSRHQKSDRKWRKQELMVWTPYADWIFTGVSITSLLVVVWLVLRPRA
jgi:hypothetical protein